MSRIPMLWIYMVIINILILSVRVRLYASECDVFRRENLTSTDVRFARINTVPALKGLTFNP